VELNVTAPRDVVIKVSRVQIVTAIANILKNAYDFLPADAAGPRGEIEIRAVRRGKQVHLSVRDTGQGIPAANLDEIRECLPGRTSRRKVGTGFGLCNARRYVAAHGGRLTIDSKENEGTTVTIILPVG
jgi:signal transduction histidine kinase